MKTYDESIIFALGRSRVRCVARVFVGDKTASEIRGSQIWEIHGEARTARDYPVCATFAPDKAHTSKISFFKWLNMPRGAFASAAVSPQLGLSILSARFVTSKFLKISALMSRVVIREI